MGGFWEEGEFSSGELMQSLAYRALRRRIDIHICVGGGVDGIGREGRGMADVAKKSLCGDEKEDDQVAAAATRLPSVSQSARKRRELEER